MPIARKKTAGDDKADVMDLAIQQLLARYAEWDHGAAAEIDPSEKRRLMEIWNAEIRWRPAYVRWRWLFGTVGERLFGVDECKKMIRSIVKEIERRRASMPSGAWLDNWGSNGADLPREPAGRVHAVRMKRRRVARAGQPNRWTPPQCFEMEDFLDGLSAGEAAGHFYPPSPSAVMIRAIEDVRAKAAW